MVVVVTIWINIPLFKRYFTPFYFNMSCTICFLIYNYLDSVTYYLAKYIQVLLYSLQHVTTPNIYKKLPNSTSSYRSQARKSSSFSCSICSICKATCFEFKETCCYFSYFSQHVFSLLSSENANICDSFLYVCVRKRERRR